MSQDLDRPPPTSARLGPYLILEHIGEGGMCHVLRAQNVEAGFECALKVLKEEQRKDPRVLDLFMTESDVALLLNHPNLVRTYDAGDVNGRYYIAMELVEGGTLDKLLVRAKEALIPRLPLDVSLFIVSEILEGLQALHTAVGQTGRPLGLIHRDVTPHNVFMSFDGRVLLGDFGVAHIQAYGDIDRHQMLGKIGYLAPELILGAEIDQRVDLFSVGVVLYELLTGERPFAQGTDEEVMSRIVEGRFARPRKLNPDIPRGLEAVMLRALATRAKDRPTEAEELLYELDSFWSKKIGNPYALGGLISNLHGEAMMSWKRRGRKPSGFQVAVGRKD